ncbi:MAG: hypothetical protein OXH13_00570 [Chloroflexi bacterium]|nr:hypothetical protein [Chloroflexota bacterium]MCY3697128.1 hypothetical protein [Chloroflexota bacterium]
MTEASEQPGRWSAPAGLLGVLAIVLLALPGIAVRYALHDGLDAFHFLFSLFFSINLLICYWEICLYLRRDQIERRAEYWSEWQRDGGRTPALVFLTGRVPLRRALSPTVWAEVWATYSIFDSAYADRNTYGFNIDIGNGFVTIAPTLMLYAAYTGGVIPAMAAGIVGAMLFWQWVYASSLYLVSFFVGQKRQLLTARDFYIYLLGPNAVWILIPIVGIYVSIRLILDGDYAVLGID